MGITTQRCVIRKVSFAGFVDGLHFTDFIENSSLESPAGAETQSPGSNELNDPPLLAPKSDRPTFAATMARTPSPPAADFAMMFLLNELVETQVIDYHRALRNIIRNDKGLNVPSLISFLLGCVHRT